jgi:Spy/CpxP family protein refolding chaperone
MKSIKAVFAVIAAAFLVCGVAVVAQGPGPGAGPGPGGDHGWGSHRGPLERALGSGPSGRWWNDSAMVEKLSLTEDQRKSMDAILLEHREKLVDMHASVEKAEIAMEPLMSADQPSEQLILAQIDKIAQARAELEKANARFLLAIRAKLTPDQWKGLQAARAERHQNRLGPDGMGPHHMRNHGGPLGAPQATPPPGPGPQGMLSPGPDSELNPGPPPSAEAGVIE